MKLFNVRLDEDQHDLVERAVAVSDAETKSEWAREVLEAAAHKELARARQVAFAGNGNGHALGFTTPVSRSGCVHPPQAVMERATDRYCTLCNATIERVI